MVSSREYLKDYQQYLTFLIKEVICKPGKHPELIITLINYFPDALVKLSQKMAIGHFLELKDIQNLPNDVLLFQLKWLFISQNANRARQVVNELFSRFSRHLDLEDQIVKSVIAGVNHNIDYIIDFLPHFPNPLIKGIRLSIVATFLAGFTIERAKQFRTEIVQLMRQSIRLFHDCLINLVYLENDEVFFLPGRAF